MSYYGEIPTFTKRAPTMKATSSSSGSSSSRMNHSVPSALTIPSASGPSSNASSTESYTQTTFRDFAHHAKKCERCYDPLATFNEGREMCPRGRQLAKLLTTSLFDEANDKYRRSHNSDKKKSSRRMSTSARDSRDDGWQHLEVDIPKGCESVRSLLVAIDRGLQLPSSAASSPPMPSASSPHKSSSSTASSNSSRVVLGETYDYVPSSSPRHHSDEEILGGRTPRHIHREEEKPHRSSRRSGSADRKSHRRHHSDSKVHEVSGGIEERERRPYVHNTRLEVPAPFAPNSPRSSHDNLSIDSGYGTTGGCPSPDMSRGSQYAEDMRRRQHARSTPKSALKRSDSVERIHASYQAHHSRTPSSPRMGKANGVGFNIEGQYFVPGYP